MIKCRACKREVSSEAKTCPHCGVPHPKRKRYGCGAAILIIGGVLVFAAMIAGPRGGGNPTSPRAPAKAPAEPPKPGAQWRYASFVDEMSGKTSKQATVMSGNFFEFSSPYRGRQYAELTLRNHPRHGRAAILEIQRGQFDCRMDDCSLQVRFDDGPARAFRFAKPESNDTTMLFVRDYGTFYSSLSKSGLVRIEGKFYQQAPVVFMFNVSDLDPEKLK